MTPLVIVQGFFMALLPVFVLLIVRRRLQIAWGWTGIGALLFLLAQIPKALTGLGLRLESWAPGWLFVIVAALIPGVWEEIAKWLPLKIKRPSGWAAVLSFGLGFGGFESIIIGVNVIAQPMLAIASPELLPVELVARLTGPLTPLALFTSALAVVERGMAMALHTAWSVLNAKAVILRRVSLLFLAMLLHTLVDIFAAYYQVINSATWVIVTLEVALIVFGLLAIRYFRRSTAESWPDQAMEA